MRGLALSLAAALITGSRPGGTQDLAPRTTTTARVTLDVNLPSYRVDVIDSGRVTHSWPIAIGLRRHKTPAGSYLLDWLEWNPWWIPPKSEWAKRDTVTPPGPTNPMGRVKLSIGSMYFLHGTPIASSIGRAASHGCLRMHNADAVALATHVLSVAALELDGTAITAMRDDERTTRRVALTRPVPVTVRYDVIEWRDRALRVYPDVYRRGAPTVARAMRVLAAAGIDTLAVRRDRVRRTVVRGTWKASTLPADSLLP